MEYRILKSHSPESLATEIGLFLLSEGPDWLPAGGPFIEPYSPAHGPCLDPGSHPDIAAFREPVFVNFCQALYKE